MSLQSLPVELLYEVFMYGQSENLPLISHHFYAVFKSAPASVLSQYLISRHYGVYLISKSLRYSFCNKKVIEGLLRENPPSPVHRDATWPIELPRRLFRGLQPKSDSSTGSKRRREEAEEWTSHDEPLPFLQYIVDHSKLSRPNVNVYEGYALTKAVSAGHIPLVRFLLEHGANPGLKNGLAILVAIKKQDLSLVRLLIERNGSAPVFEEPVDRKRARTGIQEGSPAPKPKPNRAKRIRLEDRVRVSQEMLRTAVRLDARLIVEYFMNEKGCVPDMQTLMLMSR